MKTEVHMDEHTLDILKAYILKIREIELPFIVRNACNENRDENYWFDFLREDCDLTPDSRHISFEGEVTSRKWWEISNQIEKSTAYAYSTTPQPFHCDNAWFENGPEVNFFIMKKQAPNGGENLFYPVSRIINDLENEDSGLLNDLCSTTVVIAKGNDGITHKTPIISKEESGKIFWNFYRTDKKEHFVEDLCNRFFSFLNNKETSSSILNIRCESGDAFVFNDQKLLHARKSFVAEKEKDRVLLQSMWNL